jgi:hypothetical protein
MIYYAHGDAIVSQEEIQDDPSLPAKLSLFYSDLSGGSKPDSIEFSTGNLNAENALLTMDLAPPGAPPEPIEWTPIGLGKPLTIMIREVYTGKYPKGGGIFGGGGKDMLVTSAVKSIAAFDAKPRAHNFLQDKISPKDRLQRPSAGRQGTPFVFHSPALLERSLTMDLTMVFDTFPKEVFDQVGDIFSSAAGIPIFQVHSVYLLAAGMLTKLLGQAGEAIFDGKPVFNASDGIDIALPGTPPMPPGFALITSENVDQLDKDFRKQQHVNAAGEVVDKNGNEYQGDIPYVVISVDGAPMEELASFTPTAASAAVLSRFFGIKDGQQLPLNLIVDAIKLYSDLTYRKQIDLLDPQIKALPAGDPKRKALEEKRAALLANILEDVLKPKSA